MAENPPVGKDASDDDVYEISGDETEIPAEWSSGGVYELEGPVRCPFCREVLRTLRVLKMTRTQVSFTSTLPRSGRAIVCPQCERLLSADLSGIL